MNRLLSGLPGRAHDSTVCCLATRALRNAALCTVSLLGLISQAQAVIPESGIYWNPAREGEGWVVEYQNGLVSILLFTHDTDGRPTFYLASGPLQEGGDIDQVPFTDGFLPVHSLRADLLRVESPFAFGDNQIWQPGEASRLTSRRVGSLWATFLFGNAINSRISLDEPVGNNSALVRSVVTRFGFGYSAFGTNRALRLTGCWPDLRGEWVFLNEADPAAAPWRFQFTEVSVSPPSDQLFCEGGFRQEQAVVFTDSRRNAQLRCGRQGVVLPPAIERRPGCEMIQNGEVLFSFDRSDLGLQRLLGYFGPIPDDTTVLRREPRVQGIRISPTRPAP